jgi:hypothetical protein
VGGFYATGEHTSEVESSQRGVEPVKFCRDSAIFQAVGTVGSKSKNENDWKNDVTTGNQAKWLEGVNGQAVSG